MALNAGVISIDLEMTDKGLSVTVNKAGEVLKSFQKDLEKTAQATGKTADHLDSLSTKFRYFMHNASTARFAAMDFHDIFLKMPASVLKTAGEIERLTKLMEGLSSETDQAKKKAEALAGVKFVINMSQNAPFEIKALADSFVKFKTAGLDPTNGSLKALVDSVAKFGGNSDILKRASIAIQQMAGKGVVSMEELRQQLGEAVPTAMQHMADGMGLSMQDLANKIKKGGVPAIAAMNKMFTQMYMQNDGAAKGMMDTWVGTLTKLETKWELFKNKIGEAGVLDSAKGEVQKLTEMFDDKGKSEEWVARLNSAISGLIGMVANLASFVTQYGGEIAMVLEALIVSKILGFVGSFETMGGKFIENFKVGRDAARVAAAEENALNEKRHADKQRTLAQDIAVAEYELQQMVRFSEEKATLRAKELMREAEFIQAEANLKRQRAAILQSSADSHGADSSASLLKSNQVLASGGDTALAQQYSAAARASKELEMQAEKTAIALRTEAIALDTSANACREKATATMIASGAAAEEAIAKKAAIETGKNELSVLKQTEAQQKNITASTGAWTGAKTALNSAIQTGIQSLTGFLTSMISMGAQMALMIGAIAAVTWAWNKLSDAVAGTTRRYKELEDFKSKVRRGLATEKDIQEKEAKQVKAKGDLEVMEGQGDFNLDSEGFAVKMTDGQKASNQAEIDKQKQYIKDLGEQISEAKRGVRNRQISEEASGQKALTEAELDGIHQNYREKSNALKKTYEQLKAEAGSNAKEVSRLAKEQGAKQQELMSADLAAHQSYVNKKIALESTKLKAIATDKTKGADSTDYKSQQKIVNDLQDQLDSLPKKFSKVEEVTGQSKKAGVNRVAPLTKEVAGVEADVQQAELKLEAILDRSRNIDSIREQAIAIIQGKMTQGKYDTPVKDKDGKTVGANEIRNMENLSAASRVMIERDIAAQSRKIQVTQELKAATDAISKTEEARIGMMSIRATEVKAGFDKESTAIQSLLKHYAALDAKGVDLSKTTRERIEQERTLAIGFTAGQDATNREITSAKEIEKAKIAAITNVQEKRKAEYDYEIEIIEAEFKKTQKRLEDALTLAKKGSEEYKQLETAITSNKNSQVNRRRLADDSYFKNSKSELQKLGEEWADVTEQLNKATASWANGFVDNLSTALTGGAADWRKFAAGITGDMTKIALKKSLSGAMGSIGVSLFGERGASIAKPMYVKDVDSEEDGLTSALGDKEGDFSFDSITDKISDLMDDLSDSMSDMMDGFSDMMDGLGDSLSDMFSGGGEGGGIGGMVSGVMGMFGFANGGIMSPGGSMPLKMYRNGGVANSPQLAMYAEGDMNEAYVPLPDGRSIPVTMQGAQGANVNSSNVGITINVNNATGESTSNTESSNAAQGDQWKAAAGRMKALVLEEITKQQRPGGALYK